MKTKSNTVRFMFATALFGALASFAYAGPGPQEWTTLRADSQFKELKTGEKVAFVCNMCKTISEIPIASHDHAMGLAKEGGTVTCPSCKMVSKIVRVPKRSRNDPAGGTDLVTYVNEKGEECGFMAKVAEKK